MSWVHCYKVFSKERNKTDENTLDYLALNLAFYLASWGMYRGSSFLLQKDYKIHISIARIIQEEQYNPLHGISAIDLLKDSNLALLEDAGARIKFAYENEEPILNGKSINATSTLITKILLGTLGCVPAYDRFYTSSVREYKISSSSYNRHSVCDIAKFYFKHLDKFERFRRTLNNHEIDYPPMKLMDMCFWQAGYMKDLENKKKK